MKTSGYFVGPIIKLAPGMEFGHNYLKSRTAQPLVNVNRNSSPIVLYRYTIIDVNCHLNAGAITGKCFINAVIHQLLNETVKPF